MSAVGATDPARCVYVGDRLFDDIWGAHQAGLRAIHVPHSVIPRRAGRAHRGRSRTPSCTPSRRFPRWSGPGPGRDTPAGNPLLQVPAMQTCAVIAPSRPEGRSCIFVVRTNQVGNRPSQGPMSASAVRVLVDSGEYLGSSPERQLAGRCVVQQVDRLAATRIRGRADQRGVGRGAGALQLERRPGPLVGGVQPLRRRRRPRRPAPAPRPSPRSRRSGGRAARGAPRRRPAGRRTACGSADCDVRAPSRP